MGGVILDEMAKFFIKILLNRELNKDVRYHIVFIMDNFNCVIWIFLGIWLQQLGGINPLVFRESYFNKKINWTFKRENKKIANQQFSDAYSE